jgi:hypothetical protein
MKDFVYLHRRYLSIYLSIDQAIWTWCCPEVAGATRSVFILVVMA